MNPGPVVRMNYDGNILLSNIAAQNVFGGELAGKNWKNICPNISEKFWNEVLSTEKIYPLEAHIGDKYFIFNHRSDMQSQLVFVFGTDISLQRLAEKQLR